MPDIKLLHTDCMLYMATLPDKAFDLAIVDPPYGIGIAANGKLHNNSKYERGFKKNKDYNAVNWDSEIPTKQYFEELFRVSKRQIIWGANFFFDYLGSQRSFIVWYKKGRDTNPNFSPAEFAWTNCEGLPKVYKVDWIGFGYINSGEEKIHPTQKPVSLYRGLITDFAKEGDKILDTHLGSGSSAIAANSMGFDFVGCELDKDYYDAACKRFKEQIMQQSLFK